MKKYFNKFEYALTENIYKFNLKTYFFSTILTFRNIHLTH